MKIYINGFVGVRYGGNNAKIKLLTIDGRVEIPLSISTSLPFHEDEYMLEKYNGFIDIKGFDFTND